MTYKTKEQFIQAHTIRKLGLVVFQTVKGKGGKVCTF